jgi:hypothetical protein
MTMRSAGDQRASGGSSRKTDLGWRLWSAVRKSSMGSTIIAPLLVNLLSALVLFASAIVLQDPILRALHLTGRDGYPLFCTLDPYNPCIGQDSLRVDVLLVNLRDRELYREDLIESLTDKRTNDAAPMPDVVIEANDGIHFTRAVGDSGFNGDKATMTVRLTESGRRCRLEIVRIGPEAVLKYTLATDALLRIKRDAKASLPMEVRYPIQ